MPAFLAGLALLVLLLMMGRGYLGSDPRALAKGLKLAGGVVLALLTIGLIVTGRELFAFATAGVAWLLLFGTTPPWQRTSGPSGDQARTGGGTGSRGAPPGQSRMSRAEALAVLGLEDGASAEEIRAAHRRLILQAHPDKGGSNYLAAKINEAKDVLLG
jgi:DnaJ family protein C protein 19